MRLRALAEYGGDLRGKRVLLRADLNVPMEEGRVADDTRLLAHLPVLNDLRARGARIALCSHLGRPKGKSVAEFSLFPVAQRLSEITGWPVSFAEDCQGIVVASALDRLEPGGIVVLENLRFHQEEEKNDPVFAESLAAGFELFVMDAFSAAHRAHASTRGVVDFLPSVAGPLLVREVEALSQVRDNPVAPYVLILGGAKVSDKIGVIENLLEKVDAVLVGGGMAFTFLEAKGLPIGRSLCEKEKLSFAAEMVAKAKARGVSLLLPEDVVVTEEFSAQAKSWTVSVDEIPLNAMGLDIGPATAERFVEVLRRAKTVLWNGPMGVFEMEPFAEGTRRLCEVLGDVTSQGGFTVIGGGDTAAAVNRLGFGDRVSHVSTGGGASLEFFEGKMLPGVEPFLL